MDLALPWAEDAEVEGAKGPAGGSRWDTPDPVGACESGQSSALVSSESDVPQERRPLLPPAMLRPGEVQEGFVGHRA